MSAFRYAVLSLLSFVFSLLLSVNLQAQQFDKQSFDIYEDSSGHIYFIPKERFVLIASEPIVPLNLTYPNGFKLVYNGSDYSNIQILPDGFQPSGSLRYSPNGTSTFNVQLADFNGDRNYDWFIQKTGVGSDVLIVFNNNASQPTQLWAYSTIEGVNVSKGSATITVADYDGDGIADLKIGSGTYAYTDKVYGFNRNALVPENKSIAATKPVNGIRVPGNIVGEFSVNEMGSSTFHLPIDLPTGPGGISPEMSLTYNSEAGIGSLGLGWSVSNLPIISLCGKTIDQDGFTSKPQLEEASLCYGSSKLIKVDSNTSGENENASGTMEYRLENDPSTRFVATYGSSSNTKPLVLPKKIEVYKPDGGKHEYLALFEDASSYVTTTSHWFINKVVDNAGNEIHFDWYSSFSNSQEVYEPVRVYLDRIYYGDVEVSFSNKVDARLAYNFRYVGDNSPVLFDTYVDKIEVFDSGIEVGEYNFSYAEISSSAVRLLSYIEKCDGQGACFEPMVFDWSLPQINTSYQQTISTTNTQNLDKDVRVLDYDGDGLSDLVWKKGNYLRFYVSSLPAANPVLNIGGDDWYLSDFNQDGLSDIITVNSTGWYLYEKTITGFKSRVSLGLSNNGVKPTHVVVADLNADTRLDVTHLLSGVSKFALQASNGNGFSEVGNNKDFYKLHNQGCQNSGCNNTFHSTGLFIPNGTGGFFEVLSNTEYGNNGVVYKKESYLAYFSALKLADGSLNQGGNSQRFFDDENLLDYASLKVLDFNGDGKADILTKNRLYKTNHHLSGTEHPINGFNINYPNPDSYTVIDYNSDGLDDFAFLGSDGKWKINISNGVDGFSTYSLDTARRYLPANGTNHKLIVADMTGDGRSDLVVIDTTPGSSNITVHHSGRDSLKADRSYASTFKVVEFSNGKMSTKVDYQLMNGLNNKVYQRDWNGPSFEQIGYSNGSPVYDLVGAKYLVSRVQSTAPSMDNPNASNSVRYFYQGGKAQAGGRGLLGFRLVSSYDEHTGIAVTTEYGQLAPYIGMPLRTVSRKLTSKLSSNPSVSQLRNALLLPEAQGNGSVTRSLSQSSCQSSDIVKSTDTILSCSINKLTTKDFDTAQWSAFDTQPFEFTEYYDFNLTYPHIDKSIDFKFDEFGSLLTSTETEFVYDGGIDSFYGNLDEQTITLTDHTQTPEAVYSTKTVNEYLDNLDEWQLGRLVKTTVETTDSTLSGKHTRVSEFDYYDNGLLKTTTVEPGFFTSQNSQDKAQYLHTEYTYDSFGNRTSETITSHPDFDASSLFYVWRKTESVFDSNGRYLDKQLVYLNSTTSRVVSEVLSRNSLGLPLDTRDQNGFIVSKAYDGFGRARGATNIATGFSEEIRYGFCPDDAHCPGSAVSYKKVISYSAPDKTFYYDVLGQQLRASTQGFDGDWVHVDTGYDVLGQTIYISNPHKGSYGASSFATRTAYDDYGRPVSVTRPVDFSSGLTGSATTTYAYNKFEKTVTNELQQVYREVKDGQGRLIKTTDNQNKSIVYKYDLQGNLNKTIDPAGNVASLSYNRVGHKIAMNDPDKGSWSYQYNALGKLVSQTNANGNVTDIQFDNLGRKLARTDYTDTSKQQKTSSVTWLWDTRANGIGKLANVLDSLSGYRERYWYNDRGMLLTKETRIDGSLYYENYKYDEFGRLKVHQDSSEAVQLLVDTSGFDKAGVETIYNQYGYAESYKENKGSNSTTYYHIQETDVFGNVTEATLGGVINVSNEYSPATGVVSAASAGKSNSKNLFNVGYTFNELGNLRARNDHLSGTQETFIYDAMNRIDEVDMNPLYSFAQPNVDLTNYHLDMAYANDGTGNILSKSTMEGGAEYQYGNNAGPHALTSVGNLTYHYDNNGNRVLEKRNQTIVRSTSYSSFDKPLVIQRNGHTTSFEYSPDRSRYKRVDIDTSGATTTTRYVGATEHISKSGETFIKRHIAGVAMVTNTSNGSSLNILVKDFQGTLVAMADAAGNVVERFSYDAYGKRRAPIFDDGVNNVFLPFSISDYFSPSKLTNTRGYTGHEHIDGVGLIHMNGRVYDPESGVFMSADPFVQAPKSTLSLNRYSYVFNNPLSLVDPSGYFAGIGRALKKVGKFLEDNWRSIASVAISAYLPGAAGMLATFGDVGSTVVSGFLAGLVQAGSLKGALAGAFFARITHNIGSYYGNPSWSRDPSSKLGKVINHGIVGGIRSVVAGGKFGHGFISAGTTQSLSGTIQQIGSGASDYAPARVAAASVLGGSVSTLTGGKFANGALSSAFQQAFNEERHGEQEVAARTCSGRPCGNRPQGRSLAELLGVSYSYGTYLGASAISPAGGLNGGVNGQFFNNGTSDSYGVVGVGWGLDIGAGAESNVAIYLGDGDAGPSSWVGRFDSYHLSAFGYTASYFYGGDWYGLSGGVASDGFAFSHQINEYHSLTGN